jgi:hypothetical protein
MTVKARPLATKNNPKQGQAMSFAALRLTTLLVLASADLPLVFHPATTGALWSFTPIGVG